MAAQQISITSTDYARSLVTFVLGNPTALPVQMGFSLSPFAPLVSSYVTAAWESLSGPPFYAITLIGGSGLVLAVGNYYKWVRVSNSPQFAAFPAGQLQITA